MTAAAGHKKEKKKNLTQSARKRGRLRRDGWALAGRGIGDFTEDGGAARASGAGEIAGAAVEGFVGEEREREGLFRVFWNAELRRGQDLDCGDITHFVA